MKKKIMLLSLIFSMFFAFSMVATAAEQTQRATPCSHTYVLYSRIETYSETLSCVTDGCTVSRKHYNATYRCNKCGDTFSRTEKYDFHSMTHY